ncbi:tripartite tricarboxylate transporter TctB family protein [Oceanobacillus bengalensis]|uniref:Tripartite tricarboxylate transporter TctB family protein n=1 Tax=Oceanobacillus bengalensis TaxID=1435466 RepID=A0A494YTV0_9BACI|nr:tripartite tricarboxylate transporter TctB family protein [Oceanobacillus bengalensis]RKQ13563.1 tripartite tricarboxylate transporter TctB family protein [Oceanobacillus bengalensis]
MHENKLVDIFSSLFLIALSIVLYVSTFSFRQMSASKIGSDFLPQVVAIGLFILSIILFINAFVGWRKEKKLAEETVATETKEKKEKISYTLVFISLGLMAVYLVLIPILGFLIATSVYLFVQIYLIAPEDKKSIIKFAVVSILISAFVYFVFKNVFYLMLPAGILG